MLAALCGPCPCHVLGIPHTPPEEAVSLCHPSVPAKAESQPCPGQVTGLSTHPCSTRASHCSHWCSSTKHELRAITLWQLAPNQSPLSSQLSTCCSWPAALSSLCCFSPPSILAVLSENYPYFSLLRDCRPLYWLAAASHMLSSLVRCSFSHTR